MNFRRFLIPGLAAALLSIAGRPANAFSVTFSDVKYLLDSQADDFASTELYLPITSGEFLHEANGIKITSNLLITEDTTATTVRLGATVDIISSEGGAGDAMFFGSFQINSPANFTGFGTAFGNGTLRSVGGVEVQLGSVANSAVGIGGGMPELLDLSSPTQRGFPDALLLPAGTYAFFLRMYVGDIFGSAEYHITGDVGMSITAASVPDQTGTAAALALSFLVLHVFSNPRRERFGAIMKQLLKKYSPHVGSASRFACFAAFSGAISLTVLAAPVPLQNATATFSQSGQNVSGAIDGNLVGGGWAIFESSGAPDATHAQEAVFETVADAGLLGGSVLTFTLTQNHGTEHTIGRFRLSVTTDHRSTFADGLQIGGDVSAGWTVLAPDPSSFISSAGATLSLLADNSILVSGVLPPSDVYTLSANTALSGITGFRLEVFEHSALPSAGPGRQPSNGNFVLTEFSVAIAPLPAAAVPDSSNTALLLSCSLLIFSFCNAGKAER